MALFDFLKRNQSEHERADVKSEVAVDSEHNKGYSENQLAMNRKPEVEKEEETPDIPENVFIEYAKQKPKQPMEPNEVNEEVNDLQVLYRYLEQSLEKKGYEDALVNPDSSYMDEQVVYITNELALLISKIKSYYSGYMRKIDFHIDTRKRSGMIETVDELMTHRETVIEEMQMVSTIAEESVNGKGVSQNPILSYKKGFRNGFAAITYNSVLGRRN